MIRGQDICYYCNIASPSLEDNNVVEYIDYDLDLKLFPDDTIMELDRKEYLFHKEKYGYSDDLDKVVNHEFERIRNLMKKRDFPFHNDEMKQYIKKYYQIKKEQDGI